MSGALNAILAVGGIVGVIAIVLVVNRFISLAASKILIAMSKGIGSYNVTQLVAVTHLRGFLVAPALQFLQWQGLVDSQHAPGRLRGTGAAALDRATYRITDKGRRQVRQKSANQPNTS